MLRLILLAALGVAWGVPASLAGAQAPASSPAAVSRTNVRFIVPFGPGGLNGGLAASAPQTADCAEGSTVLPDRDDAWFCTVSGGVLDPCFANPWGDPNAVAELACLASPWADKAQIVRTAVPLPRRAAADAGLAGPVLPWAVELGNGKRCGLLRGATAALAGQRINYGCEGGGSVIGDPDRSQSLWVANYLDDGALATTQVPVVVAWD